MSRIFHGLAIILLVSLSARAHAQQGLDLYGGDMAAQRANEGFRAQQEFIERQRALRAQQEYQRQQSQIQANNQQANQDGRFFVVARGTNGVVFSLNPNTGGYKRTNNGAMSYCLMEQDVDVQKNITNLNWNCVLQEECQRGYGRLAVLNLDYSMKFYVPFSIGADNASSKIAQLICAPLMGFPKN